MATHGSVPAPLPPAGTCPSLQGGGEPVWALFVPSPRFRCRVHAVEISASGHGWLSLAVKIKRQCRRSTSGGVQGDAGVPPAMGLRNRSVVPARDIVGGRVGHVVGGAVQERVQGAQAASPFVLLGRAFCWRCLQISKKTADFAAFSHFYVTKVSTLDTRSAAHASDTCDHYPFQFPSTVRAVLMQLSGEWASPTQTE